MEWSYVEPSMNGIAETKVASPCHNAELPAGLKDKISPETCGGFTGKLPVARIGICCASVQALPTPAPTSTTMRRSRCVPAAPTPSAVATATAVRPDSTCVRCPTFTSCRTPMPALPFPRRVGGADSRSHFVSCCCRSRPSLPPRNHHNDFEAKEKDKLTGKGGVYPHVVDKDGKVVDFKWTEHKGAHRVEGHGDVGTPSNSPVRVAGL